MKAKIKTISTISLLLVLVFTVAGCNSLQGEVNANKLNYEVFVAGSSLSASGAVYQVEMDIKETKEMIDSSAPPTATLTIEGRTIEGTYFHSEKRFPDNFYRHVYHDKDGSHEFSFDDTGRLVFFLSPDLVDEFRVESNEELSEEACLSIAKEFILNNISDKINLDNYTITNTDLSDSKSYVFLFKKHVNGCATVDETRVGVLKNGNVFCYTSFMFDRISADQVVFDKEKAVAAVNKKLDTIYQDVKANYAAVNYEEPEFFFMLLDDGKPAIYCTVSVRFEDGNGGSFGEAVSMIIT